MKRLAYNELWAKEKDVYKSKKKEREWWRKDQQKEVSSGKSCSEKQTNKQTVREKKREQMAKDKEMEVN